LDEALLFERSIDRDVRDPHLRGLAGEEFWLIELEAEGLLGELVYQ
jgi:hypothetical protein